MADPFHIKCDRWDECRSRETEMSRRIGVLESQLREKEDGRVTDLRENTQALGAVHDKLNSLALRVEGMNARAIGFMTATGMVITVLSVLVQVLFKH